MSQLHQKLLRLEALVEEALSKPSLTLGEFQLAASLAGLADEIRRAMHCAKFGRSIPCRIINSPPINIDVKRA